MIAPAHDLASAWREHCRRGIDVETAPICILFISMIAEPMPALDEDEEGFTGDLFADMIGGVAATLRTCVRSHFLP